MTHRSIKGERGRVSLSCGRERNGHLLQLSSVPWTVLRTVINICFIWFHLHKNSERLLLLSVFLKIRNQGSERFQWLVKVIQLVTRWSQTLNSCLLDSSPFPCSENCALEALTVLLLIHRDTWVILNIWGEKSNTWHQSDTVRTATLR